MPSSIGRDFFFGEGKIVVGRDIIDEPFEALHRDILGHVGLIQNLY